MIRRGQKFVTVPSLTRQVARLSRDPQKRRSQPYFSDLVATPPATVITESVTETLVFQGRVRTNNAPLASGRYRR